MNTQSNKGRTPPKHLIAKRKHARSVTKAVGGYCTAYEVIQWLQNNNIVAEDLNVHDWALNFASTSAVSADEILSVLDPGQPRSSPLTSHLNVFK